MMKKYIIQGVLILTVSSLIGLAFNCFSPSRLPIFTKYHPQVIPKGADSRAKKTDVAYFEEVGIDFLKQLKLQEDVLVFDARNEEEFALGRIPGAKNLPLTKFDITFQSRYSEIPLTYIIIIYCSSKYCDDSFILARKLQQRGFQNIYVYRGGYEEWIALGNEAEK